MIHAFKVAVFWLALFAMVVAGNVAANLIKGAIHHG